MDANKKETDPEMGKLIEPKQSPAKEAYPEKKGSAGKAASSCLLYTFCSVSMVLVNKSLASRLVSLQHFLLLIRKLEMIFAVEDTNSTVLQKMIIQLQSQAFTWRS